MQNYGSHRIADLEEGSGEDSHIAPTVLTIVISNGVDECCNEVPVSLGPKTVAKLSKDDVADDGEQLTHVVSPEKVYLSRTESSHEQCRCVILIFVLNKVESTIASKQYYADI